MSSYVFANEDCTLVRSDAGDLFPWMPTKSVSENACALNGRIGERYREDGCPVPAPFVPEEEKQTS